MKQPLQPGVDMQEPIWKALANPTRRAMLDALREGPLTTGALAGQFRPLSRFAVMQHLRVLESASLVVARREGRQRFNYLNPVPIQQIHDRWVARYTKPWAEALVSLQQQLEAEESPRRGSTGTRHPRST